MEILRVIGLILFTHTLTNKCSFTPDLVTAQLLLILVQGFNCFKSCVLFECIDSNKSKMI